MYRHMLIPAYKHDVDVIQSIRVRVMVFNAPFQQYFIYIVAVSFTVEETGVPGENHQPVANH